MSSSETPDVEYQTCFKMTHGHHYDLNTDSEEQVNGCQYPPTQSPGLLKIINLEADSPTSSELRSLGKHSSACINTEG